MSIFDQNTPKENCDELLYHGLKNELAGILDEYNRLCGITDNNPNVSMADQNRTKIIKETSKIVMEFIWKKLGMKMPEYARRMLDDNYNIIK